MQISPRTFESHRAEAMRKLGARNTAELVRTALLHPGNSPKVLGPKYSADLIPNLLGVRLRRRALMNGATAVSPPSGFDP